jgi:hypothetical protein
MMGPRTMAHRGSVGEPVEPTTNPAGENVKHFDRVSQD